jgi:hypothetical protein
LSFDDRSVHTSLRQRGRYFHADKARPNQDGAHPRCCLRGNRHGVIKPS